METKDYWESRAEQRLLNSLDKGELLNQEMKKYYSRALKSIQKEIHALYSRYAVNNQLTYAEAVKDLSKAEFKRWRMDIEDYIKGIAENDDNELLRELNGLSMRSRITRLDELYGNIVIELNNLATTENSKLTEHLTDTAQENYYKTVFDTYKGIGQGVTSFSMLAPETVAGVLSMPWSGANYSERIWGNSSKLAKMLRQEITQGTIQGLSVQKMARNVANTMDVSYKNSMRLVRTETAYVSGQMTLEGYSNSEVVEKYQYLATLDRKTSDVCRAQDGKIYVLKEAKVGINYPPLHPNCRSTTIPHFEDNKQGERVARDDNGQTYTVPADMDYNTWYNKYIDPNYKPPKAIEKPTENTYTPQNSIAEAEKYAQDRFGIPKINYRGVDLEVANSFNNGVNRFLNEFPEIKGYVQEIRTSTAKSTYGVCTTGAKAVAQGKYKMVNDVAFSKVLMGSKNGFLKSVERDINTGFHYKNMNSVEHIVTHELTHALENFFIAKELGLLNKDSVTVSDWNTYAGKVKRHVFADEIVTTSLEELGAEKVGRKAFELMQDLGSYAFKTKGEMIAQCISDALMSEKPYKFSLKVLEVIKRKLKG